MFKISCSISIADPEKTGAMPNVSNLIKDAQEQQKQLATVAKNKKKDKKTTQQGEQLNEDQAYVPPASAVSKC